MKSYQHAYLLLVLVCAAATAATTPAPRNVALVYSGPGACPEDCSKAAALQAESVGLEAVFVGPKNSDPTLFDRAAVWIQPGGQSTVVSKNMVKTLKNNIRSFVSAGGAYVGFCAGGFFATEYIRDNEAIGLGLIPGKSYLYEKVEDSATILPLMWYGKSRDIYWEGGPYFTADERDGVEILATYPDGSIATLRTHYGKGRVAVTGAHPEAPQSWREDLSPGDQDGLDYDLSQDMVRWATSQQDRH